MTEVSGSFVVDADKVISLTHKRVLLNKKLHFSAYFL